jgi:hypothetical protein
VQLRRIEVPPRSAVTQERVVVPTVPQAANDLGEFQRAMISFTVLVVRLAAEIERLRQIGRRYHVPAGTAGADVIERGELAGHVVRLVVAGGRRRNEANALGLPRDAGQQSDRLEICHVLRPAAQRLQVSVAHRQRVSEKHEIELRPLTHLRQFDVVAKVGACVDLRIGIQPGCNVVSCGMEERAQFHLAAREIALHGGHQLSCQVEHQDRRASLVDLVPK